MTSKVHHKTKKSPVQLWSQWISPVKESSRSLACECSQQQVSSNCQSAKIPPRLQHSIQQSPHPWNTYRCCIMSNWWRTAVYNKIHHLQFLSPLSPAAGRLIYAAQSKQRSSSVCCLTLPINFKVWFSITNQIKLLISDQSDVQNWATDQLCFVFLYIFDVQLHDAWLVDSHATLIGWQWPRFAVLCRITQQAVQVNTSQ